MTPLSRKQFVLIFVILVVCFVPILINFGVVCWIVPLAWGIASALKEFSQFDWNPAIGFTLYSLVYTTAFYGIARLTDLIIRRVQRKTLRLSIQLLVLATVFSCSFVRVLTYGSIQGRGGTYTFWGAVNRYFEKQHPEPKKISSRWRIEQISLTGEWYPAVALIGAADSLDDYLGRTEFTSPVITLYLDDTLDDPILPEHRAAYDAVLDTIFARASAVCLARGITAKRGIGVSGGIQHGPSAEANLVLQTHFYDNSASGRITISNMAREPYSWVTYTKYWRDPVKFEKETPFPPLGQK